jgi:hypothetical protein
MQVKCRLGAQILLHRNESLERNFHYFHFYHNKPNKTDQCTLLKSHFDRFLDVFSVIRNVFVKTSVCIYSIFDRIREILPQFRICLGFSYVYLFIELSRSFAS